MSVTLTEEQTAQLYAGTGTVEFRDPSGRLLLAAPHPLSDTDRAALERHRERLLTPPAERPRYVTSEEFREHMRVLEKARAEGKPLEELLELLESLRTRDAGADA